MAQYVKGGRVPVSIRIHPDAKAGLDAMGHRFSRNTSELLEAAAFLLLAHPNPASLFDKGETVAPHKSTRRTR